MKKFFNTVRAAARAKMAEESGQFATDSAIYIAIALAVAVVVIALVTSALQNDLGPALLAKIRSFFT